MPVCQYSDWSAGRRSGQAHQDGGDAATSARADVSLDSAPSLEPEPASNGPGERGSTRRRAIAREGLGTMASGLA